MSTLKGKLLVALVIGAVSIPALSEGPSTPLEAYKTQTEFRMMLCSLALKKALAQAGLAQAKGEAYPDGTREFDECITDGKATVKQSFDRALRSIKKRSAQDALKSYHVSFTTAFEGIRPGWDERQISYEQRQQALRDKLTEAWARFEVEQ